MVDNKDDAVDVSSDSATFVITAKRIQRFMRLKALLMYRSTLKIVARTFFAPQATTSSVRPIVVDVFRKSYDKFARDDGWPIASHIGLSTLTSIFSFLIFITALSSFFGTKDIADELAKVMLDTWPQSVANPLTAEIHKVLAHPRTGLLGVSAALSIFFAASSVEALRTGLNRAYVEIDKRPWWLLRLESVFFVLVGAVSLIVFTTFLIFGPFAWARAHAYAPIIMKSLEFIYIPVRYGVSTVILSLALILVHKFLPAGRRSIAMIAPGVVLTLILWIAFGAVFGAYVDGYNSSFSATYAGLASIVILFIFINALGAIFVFGAELNRVLLQRRGHEAISRRLKRDEASF